MITGCSQVGTCLNMYVHVRKYAWMGTMCFSTLKTFNVNIYIYSYYNAEKEKHDRIVIM